MAEYLQPQLHERIKVYQGDITTLPVDAIVTAANEALMGGGGVDGAVHRAAGPELVKASRALAPCLTGSAVITPAFDLNVKFVIHAVGPIYGENSQSNAALLGSAYKSSLRLAVENEIEAIAFPCISTGVYSYPRGEACGIAIGTINEWLTLNDLPREVTFCCFSEDDASLYRETLKLSFGS
jgi:O-acetyl-ADP-ribose deacetylase (regulator of RNase III)